jgi:hypothetical protein
MSSDHKSRTGDAFVVGRSRIVDGELFDSVNPDHVAAMEFGTGEAEHPCDGHEATVGAWDSAARDSEVVSVTVPNGDTLITAHATEEGPAVVRTGSAVTSAGRTARSSDQDMTVVVRRNRD